MDLGRVTSYGLANLEIVVRFPTEQILVLSSRYYRVHLWDLLDVHRMGTGDCCTGRKAAQA
jgi:hypothetical protein